jgi:hypothetical protein
LTRLSLRGLVERDVPGAGAGAWLRIFVKLCLEREVRGGQPDLGSCAGVVALAASCTSGPRAGPNAGSGGNPAAVTSGFRR